MTRGKMASYVLQLSSLIASKGAPVEDCVEVMNIGTDLIEKNINVKEAKRRLKELSDAH